MEGFGVRTSSSRKIRVVGGILKLKGVLEKLQKSVLLRRHKSGSCGRDYEEVGDVKEGHFVVIAKDNEEAKRLVVPLSFLKNSTFLKLLEEAAEEYGFDQHGALTIPCRPSELEMLLNQ
ncbi:auxin-induced protein 15A-like [Vigna unguiculata]|uniref:SAUR family protein n=1 Tax=Vigna unguiculata TaxID=3917 RepID=A0A4D6LHN4_VIGUN|nr:auxin-induced protein 15A-like [Vigna unguiculata]QCD88142.1 SAUR family protein [Vigna unguiculata]